MYNRIILEMNNLFEHCTIKYLQSPYPPLQFLSLEENETYGSCAVHIQSFETIQKPILFHFMIDVSGSMVDIVDNGRTKMQLLVHTLTNMVHYFAKNTQNVFIQVKGFDDCIHSYIDCVHVTEKNVDEIVSKLARIRPMQMTNIGLALKTMNDDVKSSDIEKQVGIFLTDGDATVGELSADKLAQHIPLDVPFHFIALGSEHNPYMMYRLGHYSNYTNNWFIAEIEQTGNVYGEILYNELHRIGTDAKLKIYNGQLYDYHAQDFVPSLNIGSLYTDTEKHYHIVTTNPENCYVWLQYMCYDTEKQIKIKITDLPPLLSIDQMHSGYTFQHSQPYFDSIQYFRLATQISLGKARNKLLQNIHVDYDELNDEDNILFYKKNMLPSNIDQYMPFREIVQKFYSELSEHMNLYNLNENEYMKGLCDDISILLQTIGTISQLKYSVLREDIQGQERTCNTVTIVRERYFQHDFTPTILSQSSTTPYRTPSRVDLMNTMSQDIYNNETDDQQDEIKANKRKMRICTDLLFDESLVPPSPIPKKTKPKLHHNAQSH